MESDADLLSVGPPIKYARLIIWLGKRANNYLLDLKLSAVSALIGSSK